MAKFLVEILINAAGEPQARAVFDSVGASARKSADEVSAASLKSETSLRNLTAAAEKYQSQMADTTKSKNFVVDMTALNGKLSEQVIAFKGGGDSIAAWTLKQRDAALAQQILTAQVKAGVSANSDAGQKIAEQITLYNRLTNELRTTQQAQQNHVDSLHTLGHETEHYGEILSEIKAKLIEFAAVIGVGLSLEKVLDDTIKSQDAQAQLAAGVKAVGQETGLTVPKLSAYAESLSNTTKYSKTTIEQAESLGLTFTHIHANVFPQYLKAAADIAARTGEDLPSAVEKLGRAMDTGIVQSLKRAGITFTSTQQTQAKYFAETGQYAKEQALVLGEVERKLGGSAEAARNTLGGTLQLLKNDFEELAISIGTGISPSLRAFASELSDTAKGSSGLAVEIGQTLGLAVHTLGEGFIFLRDHSAEIEAILAGMVSYKVITGFQSLYSLMIKLAEAEGILAALNPFALAIAAAAGLYFWINKINDATGETIHRFEDEQKGVSLLDDLRSRTKMLSDAEYAAAEVTIEANKARAKQIELDLKAADAKLQLERASKPVSGGGSLLSNFFSGGLMGGIQSLAHPAAAQPETATAQHYHFLADELASVNKTIEESEKRLKALHPEVEKSGDDFKGVGGQVSQLRSILQAYADKIADITTKQSQQASAQEYLAAALGKGILEYEEAKNQQARASAITTALTQVYVAHRAEIEKLTEEYAKLSTGKGAFKTAGEAAQVKAAIDAENKSYVEQATIIGINAGKGFDLKNINADLLSQAKDDKAHTDELSAAKAKYTDALTGNTDATRANAVEIDVWKEALAKAALGQAVDIEKLRADTAARHENINAINDQTTAQSKITSLFKQADYQTALLHIDSSASQEMQSLERQYIALLTDSGKQTVEHTEAIWKELADKAGVSLAQYEANLKKALLDIQDAAKLTAIRGDSKSVSTLYLQERADIESLVSRSIGKVAGIEADGKRALEIIDKKFIDSQLSAYSSAFGILSSEFGGVFTKILQFVKYLQEIQTLKDDITTIIGGLTGLGSIFGLAGGATATNTGAVISLTAAVAANTVALGGQAAVSGGTGGGSLSLGSIVSLVRAGYAYYTGGYSAGGVLGAGWSGGVGVGGGGGYAGGAANYGSTASSAGSGATGAAWFAAIALLALDWLKTKGTPWATSNITFGGTQGIGIGNAAGNQGGATSADAKRNIGEALSAALDVVNSVKSFIYQLGGAIDLTVKAATSALSIQKHGQGSSTDWIVTSLTGQILHFGKDVQAAEEYAVIQAIKVAPEIGLSPEVMTVIKNSTANTVKAFQQDIDTATQAVKDRLGSEGSQVHDILDTYRKQRDAEIALGLSTDATTAAMLKQIGAMGNQLMGVDSSIADHLAAILSYNKGVEEAANTLTTSIQGVLGMSLKDAQDYVAKYADLLSQYHYVPGTPGDPKGKTDATPGQWMDAMGKAADDTTLAILAKVGPLQQALKAYADQLGKLPEEISKEMVGASIFNDLYKYLQGSVKYEADRQKYAKELVELQFQLIKIQIVALGAWEQFAQMWQDAHDAAIATAGTPIRAPHSNSGSGVSIADQQATLRAQIASMAAEAGGGVLKAYYDLGTQIATFTKSAKDAKLPATELAAAVDLMTQKFRAGLLLQAQGYAGIGTGFTQNLQGVADFFHQLETLGRNKTGIPNWLEKLLKGDALDRLGVELQTSLDQFNGLVDPMTAINTQADALRQNVIAYGKAMGWTADQIQAALNRIAQGVDYQKATAISGIMDALFGYLKDNQAFTQQAADLKKQEVDLQFTIIEAQLKALNAWDAETQKIFAAAKLAAQAITAAANIIYPDTSGASGTAYYDNLAKIMADAAAAWQQGISDFTRSTQAVLTNPAITGLTQHQQFQAAGDQFEALLARARAGDTTALSQLDAARTTALNLAHSEYGGGQGFLEFYRRIMGESADLLAHAQQGEQSAVQLAVANLTASGTQNTQSLIQAIYASANQVAQAIYQSFLGLGNGNGGNGVGGGSNILAGNYANNNNLLSTSAVRNSSNSLLADLGRGSAKILPYRTTTAAGGGGINVKVESAALVASIDRLTTAQAKMSTHLKSIAQSTDSTAKTNASMVKNERIKLMVGKRNG